MKAILLLPLILCGCVETRTFKRYQTEQRIEARSVEGRLLFAEDAARNCEARLDQHLEKVDATKADARAAVPPEARAGAFEAMADAAACDTDCEMCVEYTSKALADPDDVFVARFRKLGCDECRSCRIKENTGKIKLNAQELESVRRIAQTDPGRAADRVSLLVQIKLLQAKSADLDTTDADREAAYKEIGRLRTKIQDDALGKPR